VKVGGNHLVEQEGLTGAFNQYVWSTALSPAGSAARDRWFVRSLHEVPCGQLATNWDELHKTACFTVAWLSNYLTRPVITFLDWPLCAELILHFVSTPHKSVTGNVVRLDTEVSVRCGFAW